MEVTSNFSIDWPPIRIGKAKGKGKGKNTFLRLLIQFLGLLVVVLGMIVFILDRLGSPDRKGPPTTPMPPPAQPAPPAPTVIIIHKPDEGNRVKPEVAAPPGKENQTVGNLQEEKREAEIARQELARSEEKAREIRDDYEKIRASQLALQEQLRQVRVQLQNERERCREVLSRSADGKDKTFDDVPSPPAERGNTHAETAAQQKAETGQRMQTARRKESAPARVARTQRRSRPPANVRIVGDPSQVPASLREFTGLPPLPER
jgi:hypothetical protein